MSRMIRARHRKLAALLKTGKNRVKRVMKKYGIAARRKKKRSVYPGKANSAVPNRLRDEKTPADSEIVFSDIFEVQLADRSKVRGCFALRKRTRHILALAFDYSMRADLVVSTIEMVAFSVPGMIWHSDQGRKSGAEQGRRLITAMPNALWASLRSLSPNADRIARSESFCGQQNTGLPSTTN